MEFRLPGGIAAHRGGQLADAGRARQQCLLAVLLVEANTAVSVGELIDRALAAHPTRRSRENLHSCLTRLRGILAGDDADIVRRGNGYQLAVDESQIDLHRFRRLVDAARIAPDNQAVVLSEEAFGLWRGEPSAGLGARGGRQAVASTRYHGTRKLGVEPAPAPRELHHRIPANQADAPHTLGYPAHRAGEFGAAVEYFQHAVAGHRNLANPHDAASCLERLGTVRAESRSRQRAVAAWQATVVLHPAPHRGTDSARVQRQLASLDHNNPAPGPRQPTPTSA